MSSADDPIGRLVRHRKEDVVGSKTSPRQEISDMKGEEVPMNGVTLRKRHHALRPPTMSRAKLVVAKMLTVELNVNPQHDRECVRRGRRGTHLRSCIHSFGVVPAHRNRRRTHYMCSDEQMIGG